MPRVDGFGHVSLSVTDPERSAAFYNEVLGTRTVVSADDDLGSVTIIAGSSLTIGLRHLAAMDRSDRFDPARAGLDHLAFLVGSRAELEDWVARFQTLGVPCSPIVESAFGLHLTLEDPDGIALELYVPAGE
jgi:catechol-2,3-dioxygenase